MGLFLFYLGNLALLLISLIVFTAGTYGVMLVAQYVGLKQGRVFGWMAGIVGWLLLAALVFLFLRRLF